MKFTGMSAKAIKAALESAKVGSVIHYWSEFEKKTCTMVKRQNSKWYAPGTAGIDSYGTATANMVASIHYSVTHDDDSYELVPVDQYESYKITVINSHRQPIRRETFKGAWDAVVRLYNKDRKRSIVEAVYFDDNGIHFDLIFKL